MPRWESGKQDEELGRMSNMADHLVPRSMVLFNESFATANEREGAQIATEIVEALTESGVEVFFVTHLFEFAHRLHERKLRNASSCALKGGRMERGPSN